MSPVLPKVDIPSDPGTILLAYRGSIAHGCYMPPEDEDSIDDKDFMGVVVAPVEHYFGLTE